MRRRPGRRFAGEAPLPAAWRAGARAVAVACVLALGGGAARAQQSVVGAGNAEAEHLASQSPRVRAAVQALVAQARRIRDSNLRRQTLDLLRNPHVCVQHRRGLDTPEAQDGVLQRLQDEHLLSPADAASFAPGRRAGVFPPLGSVDGDCPQLPQSFATAPGSVSDGHHSYPGGLAIHEANNDLSMRHLAAQYRAIYGPVPRQGGEPLPIDADVTIAAPIWHDWAKTLVFQWNVDGSEFAEFSFGGTGVDDAWGAPGDSRTAAHHILSLAEAMARGLAPLMVVTQASAHSAPSLGNEFKVVNWLRAAAIVARIDPVASGYLTLDRAGHLRLPALGGLGTFDLNAAGQPNLRVEYVLHNLSDADYTFSGPAVVSAGVLLKALAPEFGVDPADASRYRTAYRNRVLSQLSAERIVVRFGAGGLDAVRSDLRRLRRLGLI